LTEQKIQKTGKKYTVHVVSESERG
jgi:hypothetical protein